MIIASGGQRWAVLPGQHPAAGPAPVATRACAAMT
jgi:hypothetical protein